jgi:hypothetical protein
MESTTLIARIETGYREIRTPGKIRRSGNQETKKPSTDALIIWTVCLPAGQALPDSLVT